MALHEHSLSLQGKLEGSDGIMGQYERRQRMLGWYDRQPVEDVVGVARGGRRHWGGSELAPTFSAMLLYHSKNSTFNRKSDQRPPSSAWIFP